MTETVLSAAGRWRVYWAGAVIVIAMIIGGGTTNGLLSDRIIQVALLPVIFMTVMRIGAVRLPAYAKGWIFAVVAVLVWQVVPIGGFVSPSPGKALDYAIFALSLIGFAVFVASLDPVGQRRLLLFFVLGFFVNLTMAAVQLSFVGGPAPFTSPFYRISQGSFANQNHFSSLIYALIPALALLFVYERRQLVIYGLIVGFAIVVLMAADARAAIAISVLLAIIGLLVFWGDLKRWRIASLLGGSVFVALVAGLLIRTYAGAFADDLRAQFFSNTWVAIGDFWPWGSGLGSFRDVYPRYEVDVAHVYANHAHNDFLELTLELGLAGLVLISTLIAMIAVHLFRTPQTLACGMGALAILTHSMVDYPLRTYAIGLLFAYFCAVVLSDRETERDA